MHQNFAKLQTSALRKRDCVRVLARACVRASSKNALLKCLSPKTEEANTDFWRVIHPLKPRARSLTKSHFSSFYYNRLFFTFTKVLLNPTLIFQVSSSRNRIFSGCSPGTEQSNDGLKVFLTSCPSQEVGSCACALQPSPPFLDFLQLWQLPALTSVSG